MSLDRLKITCSPRVYQACMVPSLHGRATSWLSHHYGSLKGQQRQRAVCRGGISVFEERLQDLQRVAVQDQYKTVLVGLDARSSVTSAAATLMHGAHVAHMGL